MVREALRKIGLSDEEVNIYLLLLKKGHSKATIVSKELGVARTTVYRFLSSLHEKGLVSENIQNNVKYFYPVKPERIPELLKEKIEEIEKVIPQLNAITNKEDEETRVELYKGKEGIKAVMKDIIRTGKPYTFIGEAEKYFSEAEIFSIQWLKQVEKAKIKGRLLCSAAQNFKVAKTETYKILPNELISEISTWTYGNKTAQFIWSKPFYVVLIDNKLVAQGNNKMFEYLWKIAKMPSKEHLKKTRL
jgi:sugar-specific transcriptional regulator TrmB